MAPSQKMAQVNKPPREEQIKKAEQDEEERHDFEWVTDEIFNVVRRRQMLANKEYAPKIKKLMGHDSTLAYWVVGAVLIQVSIAWIMRSATIFRIMIVGYCIGGTCNHSMALAIHELCHNLAFGHSRLHANRWLGFLASIPLGVPASASFNKYHIDHHKFQAIYNRDADLPTPLEARLFRTTIGKILWLSLQPVFYGVRPMIAYPRAITRQELLNGIVQVIFDVLLVYLAGWKALFYLFASTFLGYGLHPISGHFISEHYMFVKGVETYSYYGPLNWFIHNGGYHNEHHDFPNIPGRNLPELNRIAPEYYENLPSYKSWTKVLYDFATDPHISVYSRIKRIPQDEAANWLAKSHQLEVDGLTIESTPPFYEYLKSIPQDVENELRHRREDQQK